MEYNIGSVLIQQDSTLAKGRTDLTRIQQVLNAVMEAICNRQFDINIFQQLARRVVEENRNTDIGGFTAVYSEAIQILEQKIMNLEYNREKTKQIQAKMQRLIESIKNLPPQRSLSPINTLEIKRIVLQNMPRQNLQILLQCGSNLEYSCRDIDKRGEWLCKLSLSTYMLSDLIFIFVVEQRGNELVEIMQTELMLEDLQYQISEGVVNIPVDNTQVVIQVTYLWQIVDPQSLMLDMRRRIDNIDRKQYESEDALIDYKFQMDELRMPFKQPVRISNKSQGGYEEYREYQPRYVNNQQDQQHQEISSYDQNRGQQAQFVSTPGPGYDGKYGQTRKTFEIVDGVQQQHDISSYEQNWGQQAQYVSRPTPGYEGEYRQVRKPYEVGLGEVQRSQNYWDNTEKIVGHTTQQGSEEKENQGSTICRIDWFSYILILVTSLGCFRRPNFINMALPLFVIFGLVNQSLHSKNVQALAIFINLASSGADIYWLIIYIVEYLHVDTYDGPDGVDQLPRYVSVVLTLLAMALKVIYLFCQACMCRQTTERILELQVLQ